MTAGGGKLLNWGIFVALAFIWGSSFILIEVAIKVLNPFEVAAFRLLCAGLVLLPVAIKQFRKIPRNKFGFVLFSGLVGNFIPAILFPWAESMVDSSLAGFLNSLTPIFVIITGILFFQTAFQQKKIAGILIAFIGMVVLFVANGLPDLQHVGYSSLVLIAALMYSFNINIVGRYLNEISSMAIAAVSFATMIPLSLFVLLISGFYKLPFQDPAVIKSIAAGITLGVGATAIGSIIFYMLLKRAGALFSSMIMYGMPFVALFWGLLAGEHISALQIIGLCIILVGVYMSSKF